MRSYRGLIPRYVFHQWKRSFLITAGIILSVALLIFSITFIKNIKVNVVENSLKKHGFFHTQVSNVTPEQFNLLKNYHKAEKIGTISAGILNIPDKDLKLQLRHYDDNALEIFTVQPRQGRMPANGNEVVLEDWVIQRLQIQSMLNQTVTIGNQSFTLVGIMDNQQGTKSSGTSLAYTTDQVINNVFEGNRKKVTAFIQLKEKYVQSGIDMDTATSELQLDLGLLKDNVDSNDRLYYALESLNQRDLPSYLIMAVNILTTVISIYNIFHISVLEKIKQYGTLRSIGATPRQIRNIVLGEAALLGLVAIPVGLLLGVVCVNLVYDIFYSNEHSNYILPTFIEITITVAISMFTIYLSAIRPAIWAGKVSPLETMKPQTADVITNSSKYKKSVWGRWLGITGHIAYQNITRNKSRFVITTLSMSISIVLFIGNSYFVTSQDPASLIRNSFYWNADYYMKYGNQTSNGFTEDVVQQLKSIDGISAVYPTSFHFGYLYLPQVKGSEKYNQFLSKMQSEMAEIPQQSGAHSTPMKLYGYSDEILKKAENYLVSGSINPERMRSGNEVVLVESPDNPKTMLQVGDVIEIGRQLDLGMDSKEIKYSPDVTKVKIGAIVKDFPVFEGYEGLRIISQESFYKAFTENMVYKKIDIVLHPDADVTYVENQMSSIAKQTGVGWVSFENQKASVEDDIKQVTNMLYGFIAIITIIGIFSIMNTITTNLLTRVQEFGVLRAIGMTNNQLRQMIRWEGLMYGIISSLWGIIIGFIITGAAYCIVNQAFPNLIPTWEPPIISSIVASLGSILVSLLATLVPLRKIQSLTIIESIRTTD